MEGAVPVSRREDAVVQRPRRQGLFKCFGCGAAATSSSSSSSTTSRLSRKRCGSWPRGSACRSPSRRATKQDAEAQPRSRSAPQGARDRGRVLPRAARGAGGSGGAPATERARCFAARRSSTLGHRLCAGGTRRAEGRLLKEGFPPALLVRSGLVVQRDEGTGGRSVPQPADDSDPPGQRRDRRVRRPGHGGRTAAEIPELAGNADLLKGRTLYGLHLSKAAIARRSTR